MKLITGKANSGKTHVIWDKFVKLGGLYISTVTDLRQFVARDFGENITGDSHSVMTLRNSSDFSIDNVCVVIENYLTNAKVKKVYIDDVCMIIPKHTNTGYMQAIAGIIKNLRSVEISTGSEITLAMQLPRVMQSGVNVNEYTLRMFSEITIVDSQYRVWETFTCSSTLPATAEHSQKFVWKTEDFNHPINRGLFSIKSDEESGFSILEGDFAWN